MLLDRVKVACSLYKAAGDADLPLLMSGDHTGDYNEVGVMKSLAVDMGVPSEQVFLDHEGYSTYESLYRARYVFGVRKIVIVTQEYHLHRALYIARELGIDAVGVSADLRPYKHQVRYEAREHLARFKDLFSAARGDYDGHLDPPVDLKGNGNLTD
jgi:vancomycin permeability regulator SanA